MSPFFTGIVGIALLFFLMTVGVPIGFSMGIIGVVGFGILANVQGAIFQAASVPFSLVTDYSFCVLPLFIFMAQLIFEAGFSKDLYNLGYRLFGKVPGGLAIATILSCAIFAAISASSIASAVTMGLVAIPEMKRYKYHVGLACGTVAAGGTLGILIPPSGILIVYGILTEQSIGRLFIAGILPGIILTLMFMVYVYIRARLNPELAPAGPSSSLSEKVQAFFHTIEMIILVTGVLIGLIVGWFTPTEAGAVGAFGALIIAVARGRMTWQKLKSSVYDTMASTGMIFVILIGALLFNVFLAVSKIPMLLAQSIVGLALPASLILGIMILIYLMLGCFIDAMAMVLLTIPIFFPVAVTLGLDPIFFGIIVVVVVEMAMITPPVGMNVFAISGIVKDVPMQTVFRGALPFVGVMVVLIVTLMLFPRIVLFLPNLVGM